MVQNRTPANGSAARTNVQVAIAVVVEGLQIVARIAASRFGGDDTRGVLVVVTNERDEILLVKARYRRLWALPGGWVDPGESFEEAAGREVAEEAGIELDGEPVLVGELLRPHHVDRIYVGRAGMASERPTTPWEISAVQWVAPTALPELSKTSLEALALRSTP